jgi:Amt family ammonium transporter
VTTNLGAAAGVVGAIVTSWLLQRKPDLSMALNGSLAGLVAITAGADCVTPLAAILIGLIGGILVVFAVLFFDRLCKIDDPVGALSVHLVCGIWGTLAAGIFGQGKSFAAQLIGVVSVGVFCTVFAAVAVLIVRALLGWRVSEEEELLGLDIGEHGMEAYSGFQIFTSQ